MTANAARRELQSPPRFTYVTERSRESGTIKATSNCSRGSIRRQDGDGGPLSQMAGEPRRYRHLEEVGLPFAPGSSFGPESGDLPVNAGASFAMPVPA
jgi:hypothetical protein